MAKYGVPRIAFATCKVLPEPDVDEDLLLSACREAGIDAEMAGWDDPTVDWDSYYAVVPRSTWNYHLTPAAFCDWIEHVNSRARLVNPAKTMLGNIHKGYLLELQAQGIPVVATRIFPSLDSSSLGMRFRLQKYKSTSASPFSLVSTQREDMPLLRDVLAETGWKKVVIKPAISAASYMTYAFTIDELDLAQPLFEELLMSYDVMVQEFMPNGEMALVYIDGALTHGVEKYARFADGVESVSPTADEVSSELRRLGDAVMQTVAPGWLYARVDVMRDHRGQWRLSELELIEPSLFFLQSQQSLNRFISAVSAIMKR